MLGYIRVGLCQVEIKLDKFGEAWIEAKRARPKSKWVKQDSN